MTVLVTLEHAKLERRGAACAPTPPRSASRRINLRAGERITVRDLLEGALIQSANDAADALARLRRARRRAAFVAMMNAQGARSSACSDTHFVRPDGLDAPGHVSSARDVTQLAEIAMHDPSSAQIVRRADRHDRRRPSSAHVERPARRLPRPVSASRPGTRPTAGWCEVAAVRRYGVTLYATVPRQPDARAAQRRPRALLALGRCRSYRRRELVAAGRVYARRASATGTRPFRSSPGAARWPPCASTGRSSSASSRRPRVSLPVTRGQRARPGAGLVRAKLLGTRPLVAARSVARPGLGGRRRLYADPDRAPRRGGFFS